MGRREAFLAQVESAAGRSPLYDALWRALADEPLVDDLVDAYRWDTPLKVAAGLHALVLAGRASWDDVPRTLVEERDFLRRYVAEHEIQTNEVQRSWMLLPCFLAAAQRLGGERFDVLELGPSAGLNLVWDRYRYRYRNGTWGPADALLELDGEERAPVPAELLAVPLTVGERAGVDLAPIDVTSDDGARLLTSFVWADMTERLRRLERAIAAVRATPPRIVRGDMVELLPELLAGETPLLVWETNALAYVPPEGRQRVYEALDDAGRRRPLAFVRTSSEEDVPTHVVLELRVWPGGEPRRLLRGDFHGAWIEWLG